MNASQASHPAPEQVVDYALGKLGEADTAVVHQHLETCESCRRAASCVPPDSFIGLVRSAKNPVDVAFDTPLPSGPECRARIPTPESAAGGMPAELADHPKFRFLRELGRGGMGVVYQAEHRLMKRRVAIKVLNPRLLDNPASLARFHQEVEAAAQLGHPNIVTAHDADHSDGLHLLVMAYVEGRSLAQVLEHQGPLPIVDACHYVEQAARGLQHAFEKKMIHRDIKPQNLMLTPQNVVKILDFGLARLSERPRLGGLTQESTTMGTPEYMAPEQATDARQADIRSDIYSLGCTLYCLLCGRPPFHGETAMQIILAHIEKEAAPLVQRRPEVPSELAAVVAKMMAKKPADRYQTPAEVMAALAPFGQAGPENGSAPAPLDLAAGDGAALETQRRPAGHGKWWVLATLAVVLGGWLLAGLIVKVETRQGTIVLEIDQPGAEVFVDDKKINVRIPGDNKPFEIKVEPGRHKLRISKDGFVAVTQEIELKIGKSAPLRVRLDPIKDAQAKPGPPPMVPAPPAIKPAEQPQQPAAPSDGFVALFNGKDLAGWKAYHDPNNNRRLWEVKDGLLTNDGKNAAALVFRGANYRDFQLRVEARPSEGEKSAAILFRCADGNTGHAYRSSIAGPFASPGGLMRLSSAFIGPLQLLQTPDLQVTVKPGQWYVQDIIARGNQITVQVDGQQVLAYTDTDRPLLVGAVGLYVHGGAKVWIRKVEVRPIAQP